MANPVSAAISIGGSLLGGLGGSQKSGGGTTTQSSSSAPWQPQQEYLTYGFGKAKDALGNALANPVYTGQRVAGLNPFQTQGANSVGNFANNFFNSANAATDASLGMVNAGAGYGMNAQNLFNQYAGMDPTQQILGTAAQYANNPYIDGMIDASGRDVTRQLSEQTLPTLNRQFSGTGNTNSTRAGVQAAIAERGAADRLADMSSNIRGQFFGKGLEQGQSQFNQNLQNSLQANSQLLNAFNSGMGGLNSGQNLASGYFDQLNAAGGLFQNQEQRELDAARAQFNETNQNPLDFINSYMRSVGGNYGGTSNSTSTAPSTGGGLGGGIAGALGGLSGGLGLASKLKLF
jgi:hypothetical protein